MPGDTYKIYEMAHYCGDIILEIGKFSGRSAVVAVEGALSNPERGSTCLFLSTLTPNMSSEDIQPSRGVASVSMALFSWRARTIRGAVFDFTYNGVCRW